MTSTSLIRSRDYLAGQRRAIIARSVAGSLAGAVPVPFLDDWATALVLGGGYRRIAAAHHIDLDNTALKTLVHGTSPPPSIVDLAASGIMLRVAGRVGRRGPRALAVAAGIDHKVSRGLSGAQHVCIAQIDPGGVEVINVRAIAPLAVRAQRATPAAIT